MVKDTDLPDPVQVLAGASSVRLASVRFPNGQIKHVSVLRSLQPKDRPRLQCPRCEGRVYAKLGEKRAWHAAHERGAACTWAGGGGGEGLLHHEAKHAVRAAITRLREHSEALNAQKQCRLCSERHSVGVASQWSSEACEVTNGAFRYDVAVLRGETIVAAIEIYSTNEAHEARARGAQDVPVFVEVDAQDALRWASRVDGTGTPPLPARRIAPFPCPVAGTSSDEPRQYSAAPIKKDSKISRWLCLTWQDTMGHNWWTLERAEIRATQYNDRLDTWELIFPFLVHGKFSTRCEPWRLPLDLPSDNTPEERDEIQDEALTRAIESCPETVTLVTAWSVRSPRPNYGSHIGTPLPECGRRVGARFLRAEIQISPHSSQRANILWDCDTIRKATHILFYDGTPSGIVISDCLDEEQVASIAQQEFAQKYGTQETGIEVFEDGNPANTIARLPAEVWALWLTRLDGSWPVASISQ